MNPSLVSGASQPPLSESTIGEALEAAARSWPETDAIVSIAQGIRWSYRELLEKVDQVAASFMELGLVKGDRLGIWSPNCAEWAIAQFATAKIGVILVTINPAYQASELLFTLNKVQVKVLITAIRFKGTNYVEIIESILGNRKPQGCPVDWSQLPHLERIIHLGDEPIDGIIPFCALYDCQYPLSFPQIQNNDPVNIQFTSGTTGSPKGAVLSHRNILNNAYFVGKSMGLRALDRLCIPVPLYHCFGMVMGNLACITHGATMVYPSPGFDPLLVLKSVQDEQCTGLLGVPTMFMAILECPEFGDFDLTSLRGGIMAGSPCPTATMRSVIDRMNMNEVTIAYGMTETSPVSFQSQINDDVDVRVNTVGRVQPHIEVKLIDHKGDVVVVGNPGEICTRGYSVMQGYWEDAGATREAIDGEGWMHTGDLATLDDQGYCRIVGRLKDVVIRGGENIYPREVEEFLQKHPKIEEVHVVGVPDPRFGEELCAWIRIRDKEVMTVEEVLIYCRQKIAHYKTPRHIRFVDSFPMTVTGKVKKFEIREVMLSSIQ